MQFIPPLHKTSDQFGAFGLKDLERRLKFRRGGKLCQCAQEYFGILHIAHAALIFMHQFQV